ncbi:hypothetical protein [Rhodococcus opacus]|uniref:hypothetical protein n=1 Tax=Rhodococcus opacus TaxID=37919 RepID=UPI00031EC51C
MEHTDRLGDRAVLVDGDRHTADASGVGRTLRLQTDMALGIEGGRVHARHVLEKGQTLYCALSWAAEHAAPETAEEAVAQLDATSAFWRRWFSHARFPDHRWREAIQRSALTIKGLTYMPTGATVAALATSLPETPGGERNWACAPPSTPSRTISPKTDSSCATAPAKPTTGCRARKAVS